MDKLKAERSVIRSAFSRQCKQLEVLMAAELYDNTEVKAQFSLIEDKIQRLKTLDDGIFNLLLDTANETDLTKEITVQNEYRVKFLRLKMSAMRDNHVEAGNSQTVNDMSVWYKSPKIELKKCNGDLMEWLGFWSQFSKIYNEPSLALEDKFQYLIQSAQEGSKARELVISFPSTAKNYPKVIESMKERFGQGDMLVEMHNRELLPGSNFSLQQSCSANLQACNKFDTARVQV
ncbi:hypothetical protein AVEN_131057-1 [Araneus ventricosus]|uniref:Uncharacterized protein n=1 Tax=Araneus ventricosus TaxID=182803 RepID=A0A4Y2PSJ5_ARAVE|nr:hypothetical protein AVEN_131057-1 [Araneus ventricosus]